MRFSSRVKAAWSVLRGSSPGTLSHSTWGAGGPAASNGFGTRRPPSDAELVNAYRGLAYTCANLNARGISRVPLRLYVTTTKGQARPRSVDTRPVSRAMREYLANRDGSVGRMAGASGTVVEEIVDHPILERFRKPSSNPDSPFRGIRSLLYFTQLGKEIVGKSFWSFTVDALGLPAEILPLPPSHVSPVPFAAERPDGRVISHFVGPNGKRIEVDAIVWFRFLSLGNPYASAYSPAEACYQELGIVDKHAASAETVFDNGFHPSAVISPKNPDRPIGEDAAKQLDKRLEKGFSRARANRPIVEPTGALQVDPYPTPKIDTGGVEVSRSAKMIIANCFDVPLTMLETTDSNRASAGEGNKAHLVNAIAPRCEFLAEDLTGWMHRLSASDPAKAVHGDLGWDRAFLAFDNPVPSDEAAQSKRLVSFVGADILRRDEARAEIGYEPHHDGSGMEPVKKTTPGDDQADDDKPKKGQAKTKDDEDDDE